MKYTLIILIINFTFNCLALEFKQILDDKKGEYINPYWAPDSKTFTVEHKNNKNMYELIIGRYQHNTIDWMKLSEKKKNSGPGKKKKTINQSNAGWIMSHEDDDIELLLITVTGKNHKLEQIYLYNDGDIEISKKRDLIETKTDINSLIGNQPAFFTSSNYELFFSSYAFDNKIIKTIIDNDQIKNVKNEGFDSELPIRSLSISPNGEKLLVVKYNTQVSEIYYITLGNNQIDTKMINQIALPDSNYNYDRGLISPYNNNTEYILMGNTEELQSKNECKLFLIKSGSLINTFRGYRHKVEMVWFRRPMAQWNEIDKYFYFLAPGEGGGKLVYWDGTQLNNTLIDILNIRDFEFSPNGKLLLITTYDEKIILYEASK